MKPILCFLSLLLAGFCPAQILHFTWHSDQAAHTHAQLAPTSAYYSGELKFSALPTQGMVELWWQPERHAAQLLARTQQAAVPIYWHKPAQAGALKLRFPAHPSHEVSQATLQLHAQTIASAAPACENAQAQSPALQALQRQLANTSSPQQRQAVLQRFWQARQNAHTPLIETLNTTHNRVTYLWRGAKHNVRLIGGPSNDHDWLQRLPSSDVWFKEYTVSKDYMGSYAFAVDVPNLGEASDDGCVWQQRPESRAQRLAILSALHTDPYNPRSLADTPSAAQTQRQESGLYLSETAAQRAQPLTNTRPKLKTHIFNSAILHNQRRITVYAPPNVSPNTHLPTLVFLDGEAYTESVNTPKILDHLITSQQMRPVQAVFIHNPSATARNQELPPNEAYTRMMATELLPSLRAQLPHDIDPKHTFIIGSSYGGLAAAHLGLTLPHTFSHVIALSGSFWWQPKEASPHQQNHITDLVNQGKLPKLHWFLSAGTDERSRTGQNDGILEQIRVLQAALKTQKQHVILREYAGGHSHAVWNIALQDALLAYLPTSPNLMNKSK